jgi:4-hydroxybenzoate polyprenyltransferase
LGISRALTLARLLHMGMLVCLAALIVSLGLGLLAMAGVAAVLALLVYEHSLVKPNDLSRVNAAFFTMNGYVSVLFFVFWAADIFFLKRRVF